MISAFSNNDNVRQQILSIVYRIYAFNFFRSSHIEAVKKKKKKYNMQLSNYQCFNNLRIPQQCRYSVQN